MSVQEEVDFDFFETPRNEVNHGGVSKINADKQPHYSTSGSSPEKHGGVSNGSYKRERRYSDEKKVSKNSNQGKDYYSDSFSEDSDTESETPRNERSSSNKKQAEKSNTKPKGKKKYESESSDQSSSAYSNSDFESDDSLSDDQSSNKEKIDIRMPNPKVNAWENENKTSGRADEKYSKKSKTVSDDSDSEIDEKRNKNKNAHNRVQSAKRRNHSNDKRSLRSRSSSHSNNSDITDVSPLDSPQNSPRNSRKQYTNERHVQYDINSPDRESTIKLENDQIDLSILMKCMEDIDREKQQRIKNNSRRVAFASSSTLGDKPKGNYTFSVGRAKIIEKENQRLLKQIMMQMNGGGTAKKIPSKTTRGPKRATQPVVQRLTPSAVNRMKEQKRIEQENMQLLGRLHTAKPTRGMSRMEQIEDAERIMSYGLPLGTTLMPGETYYEPKPYRVGHSSMSHTSGTSQRSRPSSAKSNASMVTPGKRSRPSSAKSNASIVSNASMRSNASKRSIRSNASSVGVRRMADGRVDRRPVWDDRFSFA